MVKRLSILALLVVFGDVSVVKAEVKTREFAYTYEGVTFKGMFAWDDAVSGKRPGVLVVHEWWGLNDHARAQAKKLAGLGYVAFACDMYGDGKVTEHPQEAGQMAGEVRKNIRVWQGRAQAALRVLHDHEMVDSGRLAAIGYCFGGATALQLAYSGADLRAIATFHAALPTPDAEQAKAIKAKILINQGALDTFVPEEACQKLRSALDQAKVDYEFIYLGGAVHSFTAPDADKVGMKGMAYNAAADHRSWQAMKDLFREAFGPKKVKAGR